MPSPAAAAAALGVHAALVAALRRPGACAGAPEAAGLIETHLSSLLLAGAQVYKLKKPVRLGFVDFSTLQARHEACMHELRLNRRTAPRWYQAVVAVRRGADGPCIAAPQIEPDHAAAAAGPLLDWAVQMRRFDDSQRADRLARAGLLTPAMVDQLAAVVVRFHAQQNPAPPGYGRADATRHWARENLAELAALLTDAVDTSTVVALQHWTETQGAALAGLMDLRCRTGHVREVHGDLHLGNIVWADGAPVLFDALEFNDTLRHIDTVGDLAFTFMDLQAHGLPRLAWRFISAALEAEGDHGALPLLAWWAVYRATVRAKVALLAARSAHGLMADLAQDRAQDRAHDLAQARHYLALASTLAGLHRVAPWPDKPPLVLTFGLAGAGKSVVAGLLAERLGVLRVRSDVERKRLFALPPTARAVPGLYSPEATRRTYERLQELAALALQAGMGIVVDAASLRRSERDAMRAVAAQHGAAFTLLLCDAPPAVLRARVAQRQHSGVDASDATLDVLAFQQAVADWPGADEAAVRIDTDVPLVDLAGRVAGLAMAV